MSYFLEPQLFGSWFCVLHQVTGYITLSFEQWQSEFGTMILLLLRHFGICSAGLRRHVFWWEASIVSEGNTGFLFKFIITNYSTNRRNAVGSISLRSARNTEHKMAVGIISILGHGNIGTGTDKTQQTNNFLGIHCQTRMTTFNPTCLSRLLPTRQLLFLSLLTVCDVNGTLMYTYDDDWDRF
jgi:hypothetical protein